ncbi:MAG: NUDIX domain-containing protein [Roseiarcus sp.]|jgi:ADP-ribose pyrophosphatase YjhB (NUDIX family)
MSDAPRTARERLALRLFHLWFLLSRPMTLGVRALVIDERGGVLLVRHTYVPGWHLPGGGVERGETLRAALARELQEEGNIALDGEPRLHGIFFNGAVSSRDHVAVYLVRSFRQSAPRAADREIAEARFFARDALPEGVSRATLARLAESLDGAPVAQLW